MGYYAITQSQHIYVFKAILLKIAHHVQQTHLNIYTATTSSQTDLNVYTVTTILMCIWPHLAGQISMYTHLTKTTTWVGQISMCTISSRTAAAPNVYTSQQYQLERSNMPLKKSYFCRSNMQELFLSLYQVQNPLILDWYNPCWLFNKF